MTAATGGLNVRSLKAQAKQLLRDHRAGSAEAGNRIRAAHPRFAAGAPPQQAHAAPFALADALLVIAREHGCESWPKLICQQDDDQEQFANEPGWVWALPPSLASPVSEEGGYSRADCMTDYDNWPWDRAFRVHVAVGTAYASRRPRVVAFDQLTNRHLLPERGSSVDIDLALFRFELPYGDVPHGTIAHYGVEVTEG